jgi:hypothetical protein
MTRAELAARRVEVVGMHDDDGREPPLTVRELLRVVGLVKHGRSYAVTVVHEEGCPRPSGHPCTCAGEPEVYVREVPVGVA